jgi:hypothetical protein
MFCAGLITPSAFVGLVSTSVAKTYNAYPRKGLIAPGSDADIIVFDPEVRHTISASTHHSRMDTNIYEGREVKGKVGTSLILHPMNCVLFDVILCSAEASDAILRYPAQNCGVQCCEQLRCSPTTTWTSEAVEGCSWVQSVVFGANCGSCAVQVVVTISRGKVVWENDKLDIQEGAGRFVKLPVGGPLFEGLDALDAASVASNYPYGTPGQPVVRNLGTSASKDEL